MYHAYISASYLHFIPIFQMICNTKPNSSIDEYIRHVYTSRKIIAVKSYTRTYLWFKFAGGYTAIAKVIGKLPFRIQNGNRNQAVAELVAYHVDRITGEWPVCLIHFLLVN